jgi:hypothetical protein
MTVLPDATCGLLRAAGIDPPLVQALLGTSALTRINEGAFQVPFSAAGGPLVEGFWSLDGGDEPLPDGGRVAYWPLGRDGSTVIVVTGTADALFLASVMARVGFDGEIYRRPSCSPILQGAAIMALPETAPGLALEWFEDPERGVEDLIGEVVGRDERRTVILAIPRAPAEQTDGLSAAFVEQFLLHAPAVELLPVVAPRPAGVSWSSVLASHSDATKAHAFDAICGYLTVIARDAVGHILEEVG